MKTSRLFWICFAPTIALAFLVAQGCNRGDSNVVVLDDYTDVASTAIEPSKEPAVVSAPAVSTSEDAGTKEVAEETSPTKTEPQEPTFESDGAVVNLTNCESYNGVQNNEELAGWLKVKVVRGNGAMTPGVLETLSLLPNLTELLWTDASLPAKGEKHFRKLANGAKLKKVRLTGMVGWDAPEKLDAVKILSALGETPNLADLDISGSALTRDALDVLSNPSAFLKLARLNLYSVRWLADDSSAFGDVAANMLAPRAETLVWLNLDDCAIGSEGVGALLNFKKLEFLHVGRSSVTDDDVLRLAELKNLKKIHITRSKATEEGAERLRAALPNCEVVSQPEK